MKGGPQGSGKSSVVHQVVHRIIKAGHVAVFCEHPGVLTRTMELFRKVESERPLEASLSLFPGDRIPRERWRGTANAFRKPLLYAVTPQFAAQAQRLKAKRPATRVEIFENAGHALFVDEPERFNAVLIDFLRGKNLM
jgi:pimeloyl-ACP methyl ester carboxylesterase